MHGWQIGKEDADRVYWIRPNKDVRAGHSATWHKENRVFTNFSANAHPLQVFSPSKVMVTHHSNSTAPSTIMAIFRLLPRNCYL
jgi:hypothetical protein